MIKFVYQNKPLGTGDAVLKTKKYIRSAFVNVLQLKEENTVCVQNIEANQ